MQIDLPYQFKPRHYQEEVNKAIFVDGKKHILQILHRRAGKTVNVLNACLALSFKRKGLGLYTYPQVNQARRNIWEGFDKDGRRYLDYFPKELVAKVDNQSMSVHFVNGSIFQLCGTDNYDPFRGSNPMYIVYDEYAHQDPAARLALDPILTENDGIEILIYTPNGRNHGYKAYCDALKNPDSWYTGYYSIEQTRQLNGAPVIAKETIEDRIKNGYPKEMAQQEYYCSFDAGVYGSYYAPYIESAYQENRIRDFEIDPKLPVRTIWDLGIDDDTGIIFMQGAGSELRFINYYHNRGKGFDHYGAYLNEFKRKYGINYTEHYAPHDISVRELSSGKTRLQRAREEMGVSFQIVPRLPVFDGIDLVRTYLPRCYFHATNCEHLIDSLRDYHKDFDQKNNCFKERPKHDWTSHACDCMRYWATIWNIRYEATLKEEYRQQYYL